MSNPCIAHPDDVGDPFPAFKSNPVSPIQVRWNRANPAMRDCVVCTLPFFSRGAGNVVCVVCRAESAAEFEGGL